MIMLKHRAWYVPAWLPVIAKGPTKRGSVHHCVVFTDKKIIDPHASELGLCQVVDVLIVVKEF